MRLHLEENNGNLNLLTTPIQTITRTEGKRKHSLGNTSPVESKSPTTNSLHQISIVDTKLRSPESQLNKQVSTPSTCSSAIRVPVLQVPARPDQLTTTVNKIVYRQAPPQTTSASGRGSGVSHDKPAAVSILMHT